MLDKIISRLQTRFKMLDFTDNQIHTIIEKTAKNCQGDLNNDKTAFYDTYLEFENQFLIAIIRSGEQPLIDSIKYEFEESSISYMEHKFPDFIRLDSKIKRQIYSEAFQKVLKMPVIDNFKYNLNNAMNFSYNDYKRQMDPDKKSVIKVAVKVVYSRMTPNLYQVFSTNTKEEIDLVLKFFTRETLTLPLLKKAYGNDYQGTNRQELTFEEINRINNILKRFQELLNFIHTLLKDKTVAYIENLFATKNDIEILNYMRAIQKTQAKTSEMAPKPPLAKVKIVSKPVVEEDSPKPVAEKTPTKPIVKRIPAKPIIPATKPLNVGYTLDDIYHKYKINESTLLKIIALDNSEHYIDAFKSYFGLQTEKLPIKDLAAKYNKDENTIVNWIVNLIIRIPSLQEKIPKNQRTDERSLFYFFDFSNCSESEVALKREKILDAAKTYYPQLQKFFGPTCEGLVDYKRLTKTEKNNLANYIKMIKNILSFGPKRRRTNLAYSFWSFFDIDQLPLEEQELMKKKILDNMGQSRTFMENLFGPALDGTIIMANLERPQKDYFFFHIRSIKKRINGPKKEKVGKKDFRTIWSYYDLSSYSEEELEQFKEKIRYHIDQYKPELKKLFGDDLESGFDFKTLSSSKRKELVRKIMRVEYNVLFGISGRVRWNNVNDIADFWSLLNIDKKLFDWQRAEIIYYLKKNYAKEWSLWSGIFGAKLDMAIKLSDLPDLQKEEVLSSIQKLQPMIESRLPLRSLFSLLGLHAYPSEQQEILLDRAKQLIKEYYKSTAAIFNNDLDSYIDFQNKSNVEKHDIYNKTSRIKELILNDMKPTRMVRGNEYNVWYFFDFTGLTDEEITAKKQQITDIVAKRYKELFEDIFGDDLNNCVNFSNLSQAQKIKFRSKIVTIKKMLANPALINKYSFWAYFNFDGIAPDDVENLKLQIKEEVKLRNPEIMDYYGQNLDQENKLSDLTVREKSNLISKITKYCKLLQGSELMRNCNPYRTFWSFFSLSKYTDEELSKFKNQVINYAKISEQKLFNYFGDNLEDTVDISNMDIFQKRSIYNSVGRIKRLIQNPPTDVDERTFFSFFEDEDIESDSTLKKQIIWFVTNNYPQIVEVFGPNLDKIIDFNALDYDKKMLILKHIKTIKREFSKDEQIFQVFRFEIFTNPNKGVANRNLDYLKEQNLVKLLKSRNINTDHLSDIVAILKVENACDNWSLGFQILLYKLCFPQNFLNTSNNKILKKYLKTIANFAENIDEFKRVEKYSNLLSYFVEFTSPLTEKINILNALYEYLYEMTILHNESPIIHLLTRIFYTDECYSLTDDERHILMNFYQYEWPIISNWNHKYSLLLNYPPEDVFTSAETKIIYEATKRHIAFVTKKDVPINDIARKTGYSLETIFKNYLQNLDIYNIHALSYLIINKYPDFIPDLLFSDYYRPLMDDISDEEKYLIYLKLRAISDQSITYKYIADYTGLSVDEVINYRIYSKNERGHSLNLLLK